MPACICLCFGAIRTGEPCEALRYEQSHSGFLQPPNQDIKLFVRQIRRINPLVVLCVKAGLKIERVKPCPFLTIGADEVDSVLVHARSPVACLLVRGCAAVWTLLNTTFIHMSNAMFNFFGGICNRAGSVWRFVA